MKKVIFLITLMAASVSYSFGQNKLAHANFQEIVQLLPDRATAEKTVQELQAKLEKRLNTMVETYQTKLQEYQADTLMSEAMYASAQAELGDLQRRIQEFQQTAYQEIQVKEQELMTQLMTKVRNAAKTVGESNKYTYVFDSSNGAILYAGGEDITPLVKKELGL